MMILCLAFRLHWICDTSISALCEGYGLNDAVLPSHLITVGHDVVVGSGLWRRAPILRRLGRTSDPNQLSTTALC